MGINSMQTYRLSTNAHLDLNVQTGTNGEKSAELVLEKSGQRRAFCS